MPIVKVCVVWYGMVTALRFLRMTFDVSADIEEMETECHDQASSSASSAASTTSSASAAGMDQPLL